MDAETTARVTGVLHARRTIVAQGRARFVLNGEAPLVIPDVRLQLGASMVGILTVNAPEIQDSHRFVHVAQRSGGQLMGGISLELRP